MDQFFKQAQILSYTGGTQLDLNARQYNHKAFILQGTGDTIGIWVSAGNTLAGITLLDTTPSFTSALGQSIIPLRVFKLVPSSDGKIILLN